MPDVGTGAGGMCFNNGTNDDAELVMVLVDLTDSLCIALNRDGDTTIVSEAVGSTNVTSVGEVFGKFKGTYGLNATQSGNFNTSKSTGNFQHCFYDEVPDTNMYYDVLLAR